MRLFPEARMKRLILALLTAAFFASFAGTETNFAQTSEQPKWIVGNYKGLQAGKSTARDVERILGKPKYVADVTDDFDYSLGEQRYVYENYLQIYVNEKSGIVLLIQSEDFSTFAEAVEKYGKDFYQMELKKKKCVFKQYDEKNERPYPLYIAYPQYGFYFSLRADNSVMAIYYTEKCGE